MKKELKSKKCKQCKELFNPKRPLQYLCSVKCSVDYATKKYKEKEQKETRKWIKESKEKLKTLPELIALAQIVFNKYIRKRDEKKGCISCSTKVAEEFHAGHYIPTTYQYLRFNEYNVHKQCSKCNTHLRGNQIAYRENLIKLIGKKRVEKLEADRYKFWKPTKEEIKELIKKYKLKLKQL